MNKVIVKIVACILFCSCCTFAYANRNDITVIKQKDSLFEKIMASPGKDEFVKGNIYFQKQMYEKAIEEYEKAVVLDPTLAIAFNNIASIHKNFKRYALCRNYHSSFNTD